MEGGGDGRTPRPPRKNAVSARRATAAVRTHHSTMPLGVGGGGGGDAKQNLTCMTRLEDAARAALGASLPAGRRLATAIGKLEDEQRLLGRKLAAAALKAYKKAKASMSSDRTPTKRQRLTGEQWGEVVAQAAAQAAAAAAADHSHNAKLESEEGLESEPDEEGQLQALLSRASPALIGHVDAPRAQVDVLALLRGARAARHEARLAASRSDAEFKAWATIAKEAATAKPGADGAMDMSVAEEAAERARAKSRTANAALRKAEKEVEMAASEQHGSSSALPPPPLDDGSEGASVQDQLRMRAGSKQAMLDVKSWRVLPAPQLAASIGACDATSSSLKLVATQKMDLEGRRASVEQQAHAVPVEQALQLVGREEVAPLIARRRPRG